MGTCLENDKGWQMHQGKDQLLGQETRIKFQGRWDIKFLKTFSRLTSTPCTWELSYYFRQCY